jgi:hypothetical protein
MSTFSDRGNEIRQAAKALVLEFLSSHPNAHPQSSGIRQAEVFRACGFDWGTYPKATSSNQQYWIVALLKELEVAGEVIQVSESGPWRLSR